MAMSMHKTDFIIVIQIVIVIGNKPWLKCYLIDNYRLCNYRCDYLLNPWAMIKTAIPSYNWGRAINTHSASTISNLIFETNLCQKFWKEFSRLSESGVKRHQLTNSAVEKPFIFVKLYFNKCKLDTIRLPTLMGIYPEYAENIPYLIWLHGRLNDILVLPYGWLS